MLLWPFYMLLYFFFLFKKLFVPACFYFSPEMSIVPYRPVFWAVQFKSVSVPFYPSEQVNLAGTVLTSLYGTQTWYIFNRPLRAYTTRLNDNQKNQIYQYFISNHNSKKKEKKTLEKIVWKRFWKRLENSLLPQN